MMASDAQIGIWFRLQCYCHDQMNGGSVAHCREWTDVAWGHLGLRARSVAQDSPLWHWTSMGDLVVHGYDLVAEEGYRKKQRMGRIYVERRWQKTREKKIIDMPDKPNQELLL